jgi:hypothetical protein
MKHAITRIATLLLAPLVATHAADSAAAAGWMPRAEDATQLWWVGGSPQVFNSQLPPKEETLCFRYGSEKLLFDTKRVRPVDGVWECAVVAEGRRYDCTGRGEVKDEFFQSVRFVESGRFFQRVIIEDLKFADAEGREFPGRVRLEITAWPDRLAFRLEGDGEARLELRRGEKTATGTRSVLLEVVNQPSTARVESELAVTFYEALGCHRIALPEKPWSNAGGTYYPEEHLDRIDRWRVTLRNDADEPTVARLMFTQQKHLPITGFTPMLCEPDGTPTGIAGAGFEKLAPPSGERQSSARGDVVSWLRLGAGATQVEEGFRLSKWSMPATAACARHRTRSSVSSAGGTISFGIRRRWAALARASASSRGACKGAVSSRMCVRS